MITLKALALGAIVAASMMVPDAAKAEDAAAGPEAGAPMMKMENAFEESDVNKDGSLSLQEFLARHETKFKEIDANGDGKLTKEEFSTYREAMKKKMAEHRKKMVEERNGPTEGPVDAPSKTEADPAE